MENELLQLKIYTALKQSKLMYRNTMRLRFEVWAMQQASKQVVLLEEITRSDSIWSWYISQYKKKEKRFYKENQVFIDELYNANHLYDILSFMVSEIENNYPLTLIQNLKHGETAVN